MPLKEQELVDLHQTAWSKRTDWLDEIRSAPDDSWRNSNRRKGRLHWLEVQLSEKDAHHRQAVHALEHDLAARDRRLAELAQQTQLLEERGPSASPRWNSAWPSCRLCKQSSPVRRRSMGDQEEEISRLRKRLGEVRAALRVRDDGSPVLARPNGPANQLSLADARRRRRPLGHGKTT